jgi:tetratricopeptide (TPR) repeat protein
MVKLSLLSQFSLFLLLSLATAKDEPSAEPALPLMFQEDFATIPLDRFQNTRAGELEWQMGKHLTIKEGVALVRPAQTGPDASLEMQLEFLPIEKEGDQSETRVGYVLASRVIASAALVRQRKAEGVAARIQFLLEDERGGKRLVREKELPADLAAGKYLFRFRYGLFEVKKDDERLATGCVETHHIPVIGVTWTQESGGTICRGLALRGAEFPKPHPEQDKLAEASRHNERGASHYRAKEFAAALEATKKGLEIYQAVLGDSHHDTANSLSNVGSILQASEQSAEAVEYFDKAIAIREKLMGPDHPDTALVNMQAASELVRLGKLAEAHPYCLKAYFAFFEAYGSEHAATDSLHKMLDKLPRPE